MLTCTIREELSKISKKYGGALKFNHPLSRHTTIRIGGPCQIWYAPTSLEELQLVRKCLANYEMETLVIGRGSNLLISDEGLNVAVINLASDYFKKVDFKEKEVTVGAGAYLEKFILDCCNNGLGNLDGLVGIPATIGGALKMNASYKTSISDNLVRVLVLDPDGSTRWIERASLEFGYRYSSFDKNEIIIQAVFCLEKREPAILKKRLKLNFVEKMKKQPLDKKTLGCVFKNPKEGLSAGILLDKSGMKGARYGDCEVSKKHANFIVNTADASAKDMLSLMREMQDKVMELFFVKLEPEIEILGEGWN